ncbi:MAG: FtsW/RodA/SpoVE family cell cycle protein [Patescibacteria group bacterium]
MLGAFRGRVGKFDWFLALGIVILLAVSLVTLYSIGAARSDGDFAVFTKQLWVAVLGLGIFIILSAFDFQLWQWLSRWTFLATVLLLFSTLIFGRVINGTRGWLSVAGLQFQPVEIAKFAAVLALASFFSLRARELNRTRNLLQSVTLIGLLVVPVLLQPDFGSAAVLLSLWVGTVLVIGVKRRYLVTLVTVSAVIFGIAWFFLFVPYQRDRIRTFFAPNADTAASYNVRQATIAVGSGQVFGRGLGQGSQSQLKFLPEVETDFIFAAVAEQLGFAGVVVVFGLMGLIFFRLYILLNRCQDWFGAFFVLGVLVLLTTEVFVNAGMSMGLMPVVGIPFPLLSAGGSALLVHLALFGVVESIARREGSRGYQVSQVALG